MKVILVDPIGHATGPYSYVLCRALEKVNVNMVMATSDTYTYKDEGVLPITKPFRGISGETSALRKGMNYIKGVLELRKLCRQHHPDVVHLQWFLLSPIDYWFSKWVNRQGINIILTAHEILPLNEMPFDRHYFSRIYGLAKKIFVHADIGRIELTNFFPQISNRIEMIPLGGFDVTPPAVTTTDQKARDKLGLSKESKVILFFGHIRKFKGLEYLIEAFCQLHQKRSDVILLIAGKVWKEKFESYEALIPKEAQEAVVRYIRFIPDHEIQDYFLASDMVVLPYTKVHQSGVIHLAFTYHRPVIATNLGGLKDLIQDGKTGLLVPPKNVSLLEEAMERLLNEGGLGEKLAEAAFEYMNSCFSIEDKALRVKKVYESILAVR